MQTNRTEKRVIWWHF